MSKAIKPTIRIHNIATDEIIDREMTNDEFTQYKLNQEKTVAYQAELDAKAVQKIALLERLGLTEDEAKILLS